MQLIQVEDQISIKTTLPFRSATFKGLELIHRSGEALVNSGSFAAVMDRGVKIERSKMSTASQLFVIGFLMS